MIPKFCGPKFKNGVDMAMGAKNRKTPTYKKNQIFRSRNTSDHKEKHLRKKNYFRDGQSLHANLRENVNFQDFETYAENDRQQLGG